MQYITILRKCKMRERLKGARREMRERFPLTEGLWMEWLEDECSGHVLDDAFIRELYELAVQDYLSIRLWTNYLR